MESTPRILARAVEGAMHRARSEQQRAAWTAWTTAALGRVEKMPTLEQMLGPSERQEPRQQTWQDQLASAAAWVASAQAAA